jgi:chromosome segregation ATPase
MPKLFTFSAESFGLSPEVEALLRSKNAIFMDFGSAAYVRSESIASTMSELISGQQSSQSASNRTISSEIAAMQSQLEKTNKEIQVLLARLEGKENEAISLQKRVQDSTKIIEGLKTENLRLSALVNTQSATQVVYGDTETLRDSYQKLQLAFQSLRSQNIEAIASLKVLEEENDDLRDELEALRSQARGASRS